MMPDNKHDPATVPLCAATDSVRTNESWLRLCDDFVSLEGRCALLCELLTCISRRETPLEPAGKHGIDMFVGQFNEHMAVFKQQLYKMRSD